MITSHPIKMFRSVIPVLVIIFSCSEKKLPYPEAKRVNHKDTYHGREIIDPYQWMEDNESAELNDWMKRQDRLFQDFIDDGIKEKYTKLISGYRNYAWHEPFREVNGNYYYRVRFPGEDEKVFQAADVDDKNPVLVFDPGKDLPANMNQFSGVFEIDPHAKYMAALCSPAGTDWQTIRIKDLSTGKLLPDSIPGVQMIGIYNNILWDQEGKGFYYEQFDAPEPGKELETGLRNPRIKYHAIGTSEQADKEIFKLPGTANSIYFPRMTHDKNFLVISVRDQNKSGYEVHLVDLQQGNKSKSILKDEVSKFFYICNEGDQFWFETNHESPNRKIISFNLNDPRNQEVILEESELPIRSVNYVGGRLVVKYIENARQKLKVYSLEGDYQFDIKFPRDGFIGSWPDNSHGSYSFTVLVGPFFPAEIYKIDSHSGEAKLVANGGTNFDPDGYVLEQHFYKSKDGTAIPMFVSYKKGLVRNGNNHAFLYAYGAYGSTPFPWYSPQILAFMDAGGVYAHANIRGGGEYGEQWHLSGIKLNKQNGVDDYIGAAEWLIKNDFTQEKLIVANGGSASGSLAAAAGIQRPDLFGAVVINNPTLDMIRFSQFTGGMAKVPEFGDITIEAEFTALHDYSPYHNLKEGTCYPPFFVQVGERDETSVPMHGYKFVAALQSLQPCDNPVLLRIAWGAGHRNGTNPDESSDEAAEELAFIEQVLK